MSSTTDPPITAKMQPALEDTKKISAALRTFGVVELLERVLQNLEIKDLVIVTRVCKDWKDLVDSSPLLQEITFKRAAPVTEALYRETPFEHWCLTTDTLVRPGYHRKDIVKFHPRLAYQETAFEERPYWKPTLKQAQHLLQNKSLEQSFTTQPPCKTWCITRRGKIVRYLHSIKGRVTVHELARAAYEELSKVTVQPSIDATPRALTSDTSRSVKQLRKVGEKLKSGLEGG
ncbi:putative F-box domain-containing protein [Septoria linicola]|nr:putative F-box domain-containing protein [Septoria linicola]